MNKAVPFLACPKKDDLIDSKPRWVVSWEDYYDLWRAWELTQPVPETTFRNAQPGNEG